MTVVAWDGKLLAVDSLSTCDGQILSRDKRKLYRFCHRKFGDMVVAIAGDVPMMAPWIEHMTNEGFTKFECPEYYSGQGIFVTRSGQCFIAQHDGTWQEADERYGIGSGGLLAMAAMRSGLNAVQAVRFAISNEIHCGGPINVYDFETNTIGRLKA